jgi:hypothetical protein
MVAFVTLEQAKRHLRIYHSDEDNDLLDKIKQSSEIVVNYIQKATLTDTWVSAVDYSPSTAPMLIQAAVLLQLDILWEHRNGGDVEYGQADGYLSKPITAILHRYSKLSYA